MANPKYEIEVRDKDGNVLGEFSTFLNLKFSDKLNDYGTASFDVPSNSMDLQNLVSLRRFECYIRRNGQIVWSGEQTKRSVTLNANDPNLVTITCYTLIEMLKGRLTDQVVNFSAVDQATILKTLVDTSQAYDDGDLGFTFAAITDTMDRDRTYALDNIFDSFVNMSNVINGIDFWCDHNKVIHFSAHRGFDRSAQYGFELGINLLAPKIDDDFSTPVNKGWGLGAGIPPDQLVVTYVDASARSVYKLREGKVSQIDVSESATLTDKAHDLVNSNKEQVRTIGFGQIPGSNPHFGVLNVGDSTNMLIKKDSYNINQPFRIVGYTASVGKTGEENITWVVVGS